MPTIKPKKEGDKYVLYDEVGYKYGAYTSKEEAGKATSDWNSYYERPLNA